MLSIILGVLLAGVSVGAWFSVQRAITIPEASTWAAPMAWFSLYAVFSCLAIMLFADMLLLELMLAGSLLASLFFAPETWQIAGIALGSYFIFNAAHRIRRDMDLNIKISPWKSLQTGKSYLLMGFVLVISMQYFLLVRSASEPVGIPEFDMAPITQKLAVPLLASFNPAFAAVRDETLTVDQFILSSQEDALVQEMPESVDGLIESQLPGGLTPEEKEMLKKQAEESFAKSQSEVSQKSRELALEMGRKQFAELLGRPVKGDERVADVFAGLVDKKLDDFFRAPVKEGGARVFPMALTAVLALTIYPIGSVLAIFWFLAAKLVFHLLVRWNVLEVKKIPVMKEVLE